MQKYGYIYKITNTINGKVYIGQHRWTDDGLDPNYFCSSHNQHFWNAVNKYGIDKFKKELVQNCYSEESLNIMEITWISYYRNKLGYDNVYNISDGGWNRNNWKYLKNTDPEEHERRRKYCSDRLHETLRNNPVAENNRITNMMSTRMAKYGNYGPWQISGNSSEARAKAEATRKSNNYYESDVFKNSVKVRINKLKESGFFDHDKCVERNNKALKTIEARYGSKNAPMMTAEAREKAINSARITTTKLYGSPAGQLHTEEAKRKRWQPYDWLLPDGTIRSMDRMNGSRHEDWIKLGPTKTEVGD